MRYPVVKNFIFFSVFFFLLISAVTFTIYIISSHQINNSYIEQQLHIASETIRLRLATSVNSELALVLKMADTPAIKQYFKNPADHELKLSARVEFDTFLEHFNTNSIFWINDTDKIFYLSGKELYVINPDDPQTYWYNLTLYNTEKYNYNINYNPDINQIFLWVNVPVFDEEKAIGMLGTGIDITVFSNFIANAYNEFDKHITPYTYNKYYEITSASDYDLVHNKVHIYEHLKDAGFEIIKAAEGIHGKERITFNYKDKIYMVSEIPDMEWFLAVCHPKPGLFALNNAMNILFFCMIFLILIILIIINIYVSRSVKTIAEQNLQLISSNIKAEKANHSKSSFLAAMSHEIRTPLNTIIGITQIEMMDEKLPDNQIKAYEMINTSGNNLLGIINDILDLSKIETGKLNINPIEYDLSSMINDTIQLNTIRLGSKPIELKLYIDENLPSELYGDEIRIKQILNNLLSNAIKYTEKGKVELFVQCQAINEEIKHEEIPSVQLIFCIKDTGQGISIEDKEKLFSEYVRFNENANRSIEGTGLGLNITKKIVDMMNGTIDVESEYGKGSVFTVKIPQIITGSEKIGADIADKLSKFMFVSKKQNTQRITRELMPYGKVLITDDVESNIYVLKRLLAPYQLHVTTADNGYKVIELIKKGETFDVIFMDHMMPGIDGVETVKQIRDLGYSEPIVALTANAVFGQAEMFLQNGFDEFISKPVDLYRLDIILNKFIRGKQSQETLDKVKKQNEQNYDIDSLNLSKEKNEAINSILLKNKIDGIDIAKGIKKYDGDMEFYLKLLHVYSSSIRSSFDILKNFSEDNLKNYEIKVHGIKGISRDIFAEKTSKDAAMLEKAASSKDLDYIKENNPPFLEAINVLVAKIDEMLEASFKELEGLKENKEKEIKDKIEERDLIELLDSCNKHYMDGAENAIAKIEQYHYKTDNDLVFFLREKVDMIKFEDIIEKLNNMNIKIN